MLAASRHGHSVFIVDAKDFAEHEFYYDSDESDIETERIRSLFNGQDETTCTVCFSGEVEDDNSIVLCDGPDCNVAVHQFCYGVLRVPEGEWYCDLCLVKLGLYTFEPKFNPGVTLSTLVENSSKKCHLCPHKFGAMKPTLEGKWAHAACAMWIPELGFKTPSKPDVIVGEDQIDKARFKLRCEICFEEEGACVQCMGPHCRFPFHPMCGWKAGLRIEMEAIEVGDTFDVLKVFYCPRHRNHQFDKSKLAQTQLTIQEGEEVEHVYNDDKPKKAKKPKKKHSDDDDNSDQDDQNFEDLSESEQNLDFIVDNNEGEYSGTPGYLCWKCSSTVRQHICPFDSTEVKKAKEAEALNRQIERADRAQRIEKERARRLNQDQQAVRRKTNKKAKVTSDGLNQPSQTPTKRLHKLSAVAPQPLDQPEDPFNIATFTSSPHQNRKIVQHANYSHDGNPIPAKRHMPQMQPQQALSLALPAPMSMPIPMPMHSYPSANGLLDYNQNMQIPLDVNGRPILAHTLSSTLPKPEPKPKKPPGEIKKRSKPQLKTLPVDKIKEKAVELINVQSAEDITRVVPQVLLMSPQHEFIAVASFFFQNKGLQSLHAWLRYCAVDKPNPSTVSTLCQVLTRAIDNKIENILTHSDFLDIMEFITKVLSPSAVPLLDPIRDRLERFAHEVKQSQKAKTSNPATNPNSNSKSSTQNNPNKFVPPRKPGQPMNMTSHLIKNNSSAMTAKAALGSNSNPDKKIVNNIPSNGPSTTPIPRTNIPQSINNLNPSSNKDIKASNSVTPSPSSSAPAPGPSPSPSPSPSVIPKTSNPTSSNTGLIPRVNPSIIPKKTNNPSSSPATQTTAKANNTGHMMNSSRAVMQRDPDRDFIKEKEREKARELQRERDREREKQRQRDRERERDRDRERERERDRDRVPLSKSNSIPLGSRNQNINDHSFNNNNNFNSNPNNNGSNFNNNYSTGAAGSYPNNQNSYSQNFNSNNNYSSNGYISSNLTFQNPQTSGYYQGNPNLNSGLNNVSNPNPNPNPNISGLSLGVPSSGSDVSGLMGLLKSIGQHISTPSTNNNNLNMNTNNNPNMFNYQSNMPMNSNSNVNVNGPPPSSSALGSSSLLSNPLSLLEQLKRVKGLTENK